MITSDDFLLRFWRRYILIEKEFAATEQFVAWDKGNFKTYSNAFAKLLLAIGSEIDATCRLLCEIYGKPINPKAHLGACQNTIIENFPDFASVEIENLLSHIKECPWSAWAESEHAPRWWEAYNKQKHDRFGESEEDGIQVQNYKRASLQNVLLGMMALYQTEILAFYVLAKREENETLVPLPASRLFITSSSVWKDLDLFSDTVPSYDEESGYLSIVSPEFYY